MGHCLGQRHFLLALHTHNNNWVFNTNNCQSSHFLLQLGHCHWSLGLGHHCPSGLLSCHCPSHNWSLSIIVISLSNNYWVNNNTVRHQYYLLGLACPSVRHFNNQLAVITGSTGPGSWAGPFVRHFINFINFNVLTSITASGSGPVNCPAQLSGLVQWLSVQYRLVNNGFQWSIGQ